MGPTSPDPLGDTIAPGSTLLVDTSVVLAYLVGTEPTSERAGQLFDAFVATGRNPASLSMITVAEILIRPFRAGPTAVARAEGFLRHFADIKLLDVDYDVARAAARIRAATGMRMPDAIILASVVVAGIDVLVTNDRAWKNRVPLYTPAQRVCILADVGRRARRAELSSR